jgi:hypothetical protein
MPRTITLTAARVRSVELNLETEQLVIDRVLLDEAGVQRDNDQLVYVATLPEGAPGNWRALNAQQTAGLRALITRLKAEAGTV